MSSKILSQLALWKTKALVGTYTWTTLPFYAIAQRPWNRTKRSEDFNVQRTVRPDGKTIFSRPMVAFTQDKFPVMRHNTIPEVLDHLEHHHEVIGVRDVHDDFVAKDAAGNDIKIDGKILRKLKLAEKYSYLKMGHALDRIYSFAKGLSLTLNVQRGEHVLIYADNSVEWFYSAMAILKMNAVLVTLFSTLGDSGIIHGMNQSDSKYVITSEDLLPKLAALSAELTHVESVIYIPSPINKQNKNTEAIDALKNRGIQVFTFDEIEANGKESSLTFSPPKLEETAVIMYTSGTTGEPKGVLISHGNLVSGIKTMMHIDEEINNIAFGKQYAAFLPLSHLFGFLINIAGFCSHSKLAFCSPMTLLDSSPAHVDGQIGDLKLIQPEFFIAVPLLCERIISEIYRKLAAQAPMMIPLFTYLMDYKIRWTARGYETPILDKLVCNKIAQQFGGKLKLIAVSSAPLNERTQALVQAALNIKVVNAYGATETCGGTHMSLVDDLSMGACGVPFTQFYLEDWPEGGYHFTDPNPRGEVIVGGPSISSGYYKLEEETRKAFFKDEIGMNWYRTGDIGEVMPNGTLKLIDRKKDLIKLANGEFISLGKIESALRNSQFVENVAVCTHPYSSNIISLVSPNRKALTDLAGRLSIKYESFDELCDNPQIVDHVFASMKKHCKENGFKIREIPSTIALVKEEWTPANAMLTAAFKLKRKTVYNFYQTRIEQMFQELINNKSQANLPPADSVPEAKNLSLNP